MKYVKKLAWIILFGISFISSCKKEDYSLGEILDKSEIKFDVVQDLTADPGGNTVILINKTPETISMWDYGTGKSTRERDTIRFAFRGDYTVRFSAVTAGGIVDMDPVTVKVTADNLNYVNDPLWNALTGGPGNEKTWILDYGEHGIFDGPLYYYEPLTTWAEFEAGTAKLGWAPAWKDNTWIISEADKASTMTFSLKGGPFFKSHKVTEGKDESGTFYLDVNAKTLSTTDATILRSAGFIANAANWNNNLVILSLNENKLQVGVRRTNSEGDYLYVWNFISKAYADAYVPPTEPEPEPQADEGFNPRFAAGELLNLVTGASVRIWKLDAEGNPVDWLAKGKGWTTGHADSREWGWNAGWDASAANAWIKFEKNGLKYTRSQGGVTTTGTFSINETTNEITINSNLLIQNEGSWMSPVQSTIKVVKAFPNETEAKGIWFGTAYDASKDEWLAFHYVLM